MLAAVEGPLSILLWVLVIAVIIAVLFALLRRL